MEKRYKLKQKYIDSEIERTNKLLEKYKSQEVEITYGIGETFALTMILNGYTIDEHIYNKLPEFCKVYYELNKE